MPRYVRGQVISSDLREHPAVQAWSKLGAARAEPGAVHVLKEPQKGKIGKSAVYRLVGAGPDGSTVVAKRCIAGTALVERTIYEEILPLLPVSRLAYYGFLEEPGDQICWLFVQDAEGEAFSPHAAEHRSTAGRWLGRMHTAAQGIEAAAALPDRGPNCYRKQMESGWRTIQDNLTNPALTVDDKEVLLGILSLYQQVELKWQHLEALCQTLPSTLIHGDFVEKNIRLERGWQGITVLVFDWESAGWGIPVADLAQTQPGTRRFSANPDLQDYWIAVHGDWPAVDLEMLERLAHIGTIFRLLAAIDWASDGLASEWVRRTMRNLALHESRLSHLVGAAQWSR